jgi:hypothetical protein
MIGGLGADRLIAGTSGDLLIGGSITYDLNRDALDVLFGEWLQAGDDYPTRVTNLRNNDRRYNLYHLVLGDSVLDDHAADVLTGGAGRDWFWANQPQDTIVNKKTDELVN